MLKKTLITLLLIMTLTMNSQTSVDNSIHQFKVADMRRQEISWSMEW